MSLSVSQLRQSCSLFSGIHKVLNLSVEALYLGQLELKMHCLLTISLNFPPHMVSCCKARTTHMVFVSAAGHNATEYLSLSVADRYHMEARLRGVFCYCSTRSCKMWMFIRKMSWMFENEMCKNTTVARQTRFCFYKLGRNWEKLVQSGKLCCSLKLLSSHCEFTIRSLKSTVWITQFQNINKLMLHQWNTSVLNNWKCSLPHRLLPSRRVAESMESLMLFPLITPSSHTVLGSASRGLIEPLRWLKRNVLLVYSHHILPLASRVAVMVSLWNRHSFWMFAGS